VPARLLILGEGPERARLETLVAELGLGQEVAMPGFKTNPYAYMARAKVLVLASRWEGFANVLLEALAVGTPVVATDCPSGPAEILDYGKYGQLVPVQDVEALARALEAALEAEADPAMLKARAKDFALDSIARQYYRILTGEDNNECN
jgi:glycosyltransferase involved in cell wall biosynthesis